MRNRILFLFLFCFHYKAIVCYIYCEFLIVFQNVKLKLILHLFIFA